MHFLYRVLSSDLGRHRQCIRSLYDGVSSLRCPRDRGLDHAVARERRLKPLLNLKNFIIADPSKSVPLLLINQSNRTLEIPIRPIEFIRQYPLIFQEIHPTSLHLQPHIQLSPEIISLSSEEDFLNQSVSYKQDLAVRLLKLLMICRVNKIPISLLERFKWELGLPLDYEKVIIPEFPDYFRVINGKNTGGNGRELELVCWSDELAVSEMEKKVAKDGSIQFYSQYSNGFEMDPKYKKWVEEWQKLPYVSPYENAVHLAAKSNESDKWAVAVLHELLSLFVGKKAERESLLWLGEYLGLRPRFKVAFLQHPGIFYVSSKIGTHTVVLKDGFKRGMLIERHALLDMRFKYVHLMNVVKDEEKSKSKQQKSRSDVNKGDVEESEGAESGEEEDNDELYDSSDEDDEDESEGEMKRGKFKSSRNVVRRSIERSTHENEYESSTRVSSKRDVHGDSNESRRSWQNFDDYEDGDEGENATKGGKLKRNFSNFEEKNSKSSVPRRTYGRSSQKNEYESSTRFPRQTNVRGDRNDTRSIPPQNGRTNLEYEQFSRRINVCGDPNEPRRSRKIFYDYKDGVAGENGIKRGKVRRNVPSFEEKSYNPSVARRAYGRSSQKNEYASSTRFSKRTNTRDDRNDARTSPQKFDISRKWGRDRTEKTHT